MLKEFKKFISRGNVVDLAVGVIVGGAFSKIVTSLVNDIIMPIIGVVIGGIDFTTISITFRDATINIGAFIQNIIDFLIIAFCIFMMIRFLNKLTSLMNREQQKEEEKKEETPKVSEEILLLREINESLKKNNAKTVKKNKNKEA
ncbi:MAG: large conductance mechanosensitive channel protein MscL [Firmicutes bacterium]|nr:large conductance mechanosensitive channel protein MscL [Bacillota bacterium]